MKKVLLIIFTMLLLTGCKQEKFYLEDKYYENNNLIEPTVEEVNKLFENKESFAAFVYTPGCISCA
jgi:PBP1b-binding outer membrane lipoprotein LpoB